MKKKVFLTNYYVIIVLILLLQININAQKSYFAYLQALPIYISSCMDIQEDLTKQKVISLYDEITNDISKRYLLIESQLIQTQLREDIKNPVGDKFKKFIINIETISVQADSFYQTKILPVENALADSLKLSADKIAELKNQLLNLKYEYCEKFNRMCVSVVNNSFQYVLTLSSEVSNNADLEPVEKDLLQISALRSYLYILKDIRKFNSMSVQEKMSKLLH